MYPPSRLSSSDARLSFGTGLLRYVRKRTYIRLTIVGVQVELRACCLTLVVEVVAAHIHAWPSVLVGSLLIVGANHPCPGHIYPRTNIL